MVKIYTNSSFSYKKRSLHTLHTSPALGDKRETFGRRSAHFSGPSGTQLQAAEGLPVRGGSLEGARGCVVQMENEPCEMAEEVKGTGNGSQEN